MGSFFKRLGRGIIFVFALPVCLVMFALFAVYALLSFSFTLLSTVPAYFRGETVTGPTAVDIAAGTKLAEQKRLEQIPQSTPIVQPSTTIIFNNPPVQPPTPNQNINYIQHDGAVYKKVETHDVAALPTDVVVEEEDR